jgi:hypothetical protein
MLKEFKYVVHKPGDDIVKEGSALHSLSFSSPMILIIMSCNRDRGQKFYIIISGSCNVHKQGIGDE